MIHEIFPHKFNNQYLNTKIINETDYILYFKENTLLLKAKQEEPELPQKKDFVEIIDNIERTFLFTLNGASCFLLWDCPTKDDKNYTFKEISFFRTLKQKEIAWICIVGFHLTTWYQQNKYCGKCGSPIHPATNERALTCNNCKHTIYPKISPAIIVAIINKDKIVLATNPNFINNWYSLVAGYTDIGESLEETVIREVKEEVGLDVKNIRYYKSSPWPFSGSMMIGFFAEADDNQPISVDNIEITDARWFSRGNLPNHPPTLSIAGEMIEKFEKGEI